MQASISTNNTHYILAENTLFEISFNSFLKLLRFQVDRISRKGVFVQIS